MLFSLFLLLLIIIDATEARQYILVSKVQLNFTSAQAFCANTYGTNLATISDANDHAALVTLMRGLGSDPNKKAWIGLNDIASEAGTDRNGSWAFTSGGSYTFKDAWNSGEPTNSAGNEDCVVMETNNGFYDDKSCAELHFFFCDDAINPRYIPYVNERRTFEDAEQFCIRNHGRRVATIRDQVEQDLLFGLIGDLGLNQTGTWIGLNDRITEAGTNPIGPWQWTSGFFFSFQNFGLQEPSGVSGEDCVEVVGVTRGAFLKLAPGAWNDVDCNRLISLVCDNNFDALIITKSPTISIPPVPPPQDNEEDQSAAAAAENALNPNIFIITGATVGAVVMLIAGLVTFHKRRRSFKQSENKPGKTLSEQFDAASNQGPFSLTAKYLHQLEPTHYFHQTRKQQQQQPHPQTTTMAMIASSPPPGLGYTHRDHMMNFEP